jgi:hypothetical protein
MNDPTNGPLPLRQIHDAVVFKAVRGGFLDPLRLFFKEMELEWSDCKTARAFRRNKKPIIQLGRAFFTKEVKNESEAADVIFHELMHHLLRHLSMMADLLKRGYSHANQNIAMDAINNSTLASVGCAGFFERYYKDELEYAFLRPNSKEFRIRSGVWRWRKLKPVSECSKSKAAEFYGFYWRLYALKVTLQEALDFIKKHFPEGSGTSELIGEHADGEPASPQQDEPPPDADPEPLFNEADAQKVLEALNVMAQAVAKKTSDNFAEIIRRVATTLVRDGAERAERRLYRKPPAKLNRRDIINIERDKNLFQKADYRLREITLLPDISGSMDKYIPFMIGLIQKLRKADLVVRTICWASRPVEVPFTDVLQGKLPSKAGRGGTDGEALARFIQQEGIEQAVIITDNQAGSLQTRITANVQLCLVEGSAMSGSFLDRTVVPRCTVHQLKLAH